MPRRVTLRYKVGMGSRKRLECPKGHAGEGEPEGKTARVPGGAGNSSWQQPRGAEGRRGSRD